MTDTIPPHLIVRGDLYDLDGTVAEAASIMIAHGAVAVQWSPDSLPVLINAPSLRLRGYNAQGTCPAQPVYLQSYVPDEPQRPVSPNDVAMGTTKPQLHVLWHRSKGNQ